MKKVIKEDTVSEYVALDLVRPNGRYYGVVSQFGDSKGCITREAFETGNFIVLCVKNLTNGNGWEVPRSSGLVDTIKFLFDSGFTVYEFDSPQELFRWLAN